MKKFLALLLSMVMLMAVMMPAASAAAASAEELPVIYLAGKRNNPIIKADGSVAKDPSGIDRNETFKASVGSVLEELGKALITGDYSDYIDAFVDAVAPVYDEYRLDKNGEASDGSHIPWDYKTAPIQKNGSGYYMFYYDWRLSPLVIADELEVYVERVLAATGKDKVNFHGRCMGTNFVMAYVAKSMRGDYDHPFRLGHLVFNTPGLGGYITLGSLLSGAIEFDPDTIDRFVNNYLENGDLVDDPAMSLLLASVVSLMNYAKVLGWGTEQVTDIYNNIAEELLPRMALSTYGIYPSFWSMVSDKYYDKAIATIFNTPELKEEYAGLIAKADAYHALLGDTNPETGRPLYEDILLELDSQGHHSAVFAKYGKPSIPMFPESEITGDFRGTVTELSFGATGAEVGVGFSKEYLQAAKAKGTEKYISPDKTVDASTCLFPETTWFIKNIAHDGFPGEFDVISRAFFSCDGELTTDVLEKFPRYLDYVGGKVVPDETKKEESSWTKDPIALLMRILGAIITLLTNLIISK